LFVVFCVGFLHRRCGSVSCVHVLVRIAEFHG
jgi:hypothetical protein